MCSEYRLQSALNTSRNRGGWRLPKTLGPSLLASSYGAIRTTAKIKLGFPAALGLLQLEEVIVARAGAKGDQETADAAAGARSRRGKVPSTIAPAILKHYHDLNNEQREIVAHLEVHCS
jgi:hypothetical protein